MIKVLFVCTGNICRSSSAEAVLRHEVTKKGCACDFLIDSSGTHGYHIGEPPDSRAIKLAEKRGISMDSMTARKTTTVDFHEFDHIIAMDQGHYRILENMIPDKPRAQLSLFMDYCESTENKDVPDPYYGEIQGFEEVLDILEEGVRGFLDQHS